MPGIRERAFLHAVHDGACAQFTTVLSPDYDANHRDHFHLDLARRGPDGPRHRVQVNRLASGMRLASEMAGN